MKKVLLGCLIFMVNIFAAQAQNWTATDIDGNVHTLQDYLNDGKTVLVDISAHWCDNCWEWHEQGIMQKIYEEFGPDGTDDVMIFFIDGSSSSSLALLGGAAGSEGDWISTTPFPIIGPNGQGSAIKTMYGVNSYPRLFVHCPGSTAGVEISRTIPMSQFIQSWTNECPSPWSNGTNDATLFVEPDRGFCSSGYPDVTLYNQGTVPISSAAIAYEENGAVLGTYNWTAPDANSEISPLDISKIRLDGFTPTNNVPFTARITSINGTADNHQPGNEESYKYSSSLVPPASAYSVTIKIYTDYYPGHTSWELKNSAGNVILSDSYAAGNGDALGGGGPDAEKVHTYTASLSANNCYTFFIEDSNGDGMHNFHYQTGVYYNGVLGYEILNSNNTPIVSKLTTTSSSSWKRLVFSEEFEYFKSPGFVNNEELTIENGIKVFPNPSTGGINIELAATNLQGKLLVRIFDNMGKQIIEQSYQDPQQVYIDGTKLPEGIYYIEVSKNGDILGAKTVVRVN